MSESKISESMFVSASSGNGTIDAPPTEERDTGLSPSGRSHGGLSQSPHANNNNNVYMSRSSRNSATFGRVPAPLQPPHPENVSLIANIAPLPILEVFRTEYAVIGQGGFGCVISPALIFQSSTDVTESNKQFYVTKLIDGNDDYEYDIAKIIESKLDKNENVGLFPVDSLECGIRLDTLQIGRAHV